MAVSKSRSVCQSFSHTSLYHSNGPLSIINFPIIPSKMKTHHSIYENVSLIHDEIFPLLRNRACSSYSPYRNSQCQDGPLYQEIIHCGEGWTNGVYGRPT